MSLWTTPVVAWLFAGAVTLAVAQDVMVKHVSVVDEMGRGVPAEIRTMDPKDQQGHFIYTDDRGIARPNRACPNNMRLITKPKVENVYEKDSRPPYCQEDVKVTLRMSSVKYTLLGIADSAAKRRDYGTAAALYMDSATRLASTDPEAAKKAEANAYTALQAKAGKKILSFDPEQDKKVLSKEGVDYLKDYQATNKLPVTGKFDWHTAAKISTNEPNSFVREAYASEATQAAARMR